MTLEQKLEREIQRLYGKAKHNYRAAYALSVIAVLTSILAGLAVAGQWFPLSVRAVLSASPGAILIVRERLKFEERASWHYRKLHSIEGLLHQLCYQGKSEANMSEQWRNITDELRPLWPTFGKAPKRSEP